MTTEIIRQIAAGEPKLSSIYFLNLIMDLDPELGNHIRHSGVTNPVQILDEDNKKLLDRGLSEKELARIDQIYTDNKHIRPPTRFHFF